MTTFPRPWSPSPPGPNLPSGHDSILDVISRTGGYAHRLITARDYAGRGLGADLIDWAGLRGQRLYGAKWIRIDVWTSNAALHDYYGETGFERCGSCADPGYPSGALFQKRVSAITESRFPPFTEYPVVLEPAADFARAAGWHRAS